MSTSTSYTTEWDPIDLWIDAVCRGDDRDVLFEISSCGSPSSPSLSQVLSSGKSDFDHFAVCCVEDAMMLALDGLVTWDKTSDSVDCPRTLESFAHEREGVDLDSVAIADSTSLQVRETLPPVPLMPSPKPSPKKPARTPRAVPRAAASRGMQKRMETSPGTTQPTAKKIRPHKARTTSHAKVHLRKCKQRSYERTYRGRLRNQRSHNESEWLACEAKLRALLRRKTVLVQESREKNSLLSKNTNALHDHRSLQEERAYLTCVESWRQALDIWGVETEESRCIRYQINVLPQPQPYPTFSTFTW